MGNIFTRKAGRPRFKSMLGDWFSNAETRRLRQHARAYKTILAEPLEGDTVSLFQSRLNNTQKTLENRPKGTIYKTMKTMGLVSGGKRRTTNPTRRWKKSKSKRLPYS